MRKTEAYDYLCQNLDDSTKKIPICLWENYLQTYHNQKENLSQCLESVNTFQFKDDQKDEEKEIPKAENNRTENTGFFFFK